MSTIPQDTQEKQRNASNPDASVWVSANAGSGKTYVLAQRVVRLLLKGTDPSKILCLTFTKSAAAEMATRIFRILSVWTMLGDQELSAEVEAIEGRKPKEDRLPDARRLFARALETPGGLKIQTIHAFCEALLHQFPLEAGISSHFSVLDERSQSELLENSRIRVFRRAAESQDSSQGKLLKHLIGLMSDMAIEKAVREVINKRDRFSTWIESSHSIDGALDDLRRFLKLKTNETSDEIMKRILDSEFIPQGKWSKLASILAMGGKKDADRGEKIHKAIQAKSTAVKYDLWFSVFFNKDGQPAKQLLNKEVDKSNPGLKDDMSNEQARLAELEEKRKLAVTFEVNRSLLSLANQVLEEYEQLKMRQGVLDFEDLVIHTAKLMTESNAAQWVQFKLDHGLNHILVDEAQDTSPRQWELINALAAEFYAGKGAREAERTIFAVGDEKQSIYSFQGAEPAYFSSMRRKFSSSARDAEKKFNDVKLNLSFRSTENVLGAVDEVFSHEHAYKGLSHDSTNPVHEGIRRNSFGLVEIWPPELPLETETDEDWTKPIDREGPSSPIVRLADRMANKINGMITGGQFQAGDFLVLLRNRGPFIESLNRALKRMEIPIAGSDRLVLTDHIAVRDLISLGRFILLTDDDLSLAEVLKSPLFNLDEEQLFKLAYGRSGNLVSELAKKAKVEKIFKDANNKFKEWRKLAKISRPFEFFSRVLGPDGGRSAFRGRMGLEVDDVLDEFLSLALEYERFGTPSMEGFFSWLLASQTQIKRELGTGTDAVRIMTVHGAKGLEAPVVFVVDSGARPVHPSHDPAILEIVRENGEEKSSIFSWLPTKSDRPQQMQELLESELDESREEYRRLLYVAMTRARDQLYVCSWAPKSGPAEDCWYSLVSGALTNDSNLESDDEAENKFWRWQKNSCEIEQTGNKIQNKSNSKSVPLPKWISKKAGSFNARRKLVPSDALDLIGNDPPQSDNWIQSMVDNLTAKEKDEGKLRGTCMHKLFEVLPDIDKSDRLKVAENLIERSFASMTGKNADEIISEVLKVLDKSEFAGVFSDGSRAEVAVAGKLKGKNGRFYDVLGQIDRLVVSEEEVLIVDFKSNRKLIESVEEIPKAYVAQLGIYFLLMKSYFPLHRVRAAILWTRNAKLVEIGEDLLMQVAGSFLSKKAFEELPFQN